MALRSLSYLPNFRRTNRPIVSGDYNLSENDLGVIMTLQNTTCFFPVYSTAQDGREYGVKNSSGGLVTIQATSGEFFLIAGRQVPSFTFPTDEARQITRETTSHLLIIV